jgi:hypothetical protein
MPDTIPIAAADIPPDDKYDAILAMLHRIDARVEAQGREIRTLVEMLRSRATLPPVGYR